MCKEMQKGVKTGGRGGKIGDFRRESGERMSKVFVREKEDAKEVWG